MRDQIADGSIELEDLLALGSRAQLRVVVTAAHAYTLGRSMALQRYGAKAVRLGPFDIARERVVEDLSFSEAVADDSW